VLYVNSCRDRSYVFVNIFEQGTFRPKATTLLSTAFPDAKISSLCITIWPGRSIIKKKLLHLKWEWLQGLMGVRRGSSGFRCLLGSWVLWGLQAFECSRGEGFRVLGACASVHGVS
jgi:hypothetical protein